MYTTAIISEYNPFHNGHLYQIKETRKKLGGDAAIVAIMSGNYVQRGTPAIFEKYERAKSAVLSGADLVIELPLIYALSSAEYFASGAMMALSRLGIITHLSFGSELGDIDILTKTAKALLSPSIDDKIKAHLKTGVSYPVARQNALDEIDSELAKTLSEPNNILGIEYIKAILSQNLEIRPITITRFGASHDSSDIISEYSSASNIRKLLLGSNEDTANSLVPNYTTALFSSDKVDILGMEHDILCFLRRCPREYFGQLLDASEGLDNRFYNAILNATSVKDIIDFTKTKRYTESRIRRMIMHSYLGITKDMYSFDIPYLRVLGFNSKGRALLKSLKDICDTPLIIKPSKPLELDANGRKLLDLDILATDLYNLASQNPVNYKANAELRKTPFYHED